MATAASRTERRDLGIESLRGIAVLLMVGGHIIGDRPDAGIEVADDSWWRFSVLALDDVRMPLFTVLSGYVYALRPVTAPSGLRQLVRGKVRRLLVPFAVLVPLMFAVKLLAPGVRDRPDPGDLAGAYFFGYEHLWFLQAIFQVILVVGLLDAFSVLDRWRNWCLVAAAAGLFSVFVHLPTVDDPVSVNDAIWLLPFFLLGYAARVHADRLLSPRRLALVAVALVPVFLLRLWTVIGAVDVPEVPDRALSLAVGVLVVVTLLAVRHVLTSRLLVWTGGFSFGVFLLHQFGGQGANIAAQVLGIRDPVPLFLIGMVAGVGLPILFELVFGRYAWVSWTILGQRPRPRRSRPQPVGSPVTDL
jgi:peptidoglycan/LPS O-acetylase OafA/YrhL